MTADKPAARFVGPVLVVAGAVLALACTLLFPAVEGLGTKVRLPVFHGAMTWVNLATFSLLAVTALVYLFSRSTAAYRWEEALRWVAVPMWVVGSALGLIAALNTWDFTGSKSSPLEVAAADPRLVAQFWILLAALGLIALGLLVESRFWLAAADFGFVVIAWAVLMRAVLGPGRALHPDSPVMNSEELIIKAMFFGIVGGIGLATMGAVMMIRRARAAAHPPTSELGQAVPETV